MVTTEVEGVGPAFVCYDDELAFYERYELCKNPGAIMAAAGVRKALINFAGAGGCDTLARNVRTDQSVDASYAKICSWTHSQDDVVFGTGGAKIQGALEYELDRAKPGAFDIGFIVAACAPSMVGDDIEGIAHGLQEKYGIPMIACDGAGFRGSYVDGADDIYAQLIGKIAKEAAPEAGRVNLVGPHLVGSKNWKNDLEEIKRLLQALGLTINCVLTNDTPLSDIQGFFRAEASIMLSFEELPRFKKACAGRSTRIIGQELLPPYGSVNTEQWLQAIAGELGVEKGKVDSLLGEDYRRVARILSGNYNSSWVLQGLLNRYAAILAPASFGAALARSLLYDFHIFPKVVALYYTSPEAFERAKKCLGELEGDITVLGNPNRLDVADLAMQKNVDFALGQRSDRQMFESIGITHLPLAFPYYFNQFCFIPWPYAGIRGTLNLVSELATLFNELTHEKGKWRYYPYSPIDQKYHLSERFIAPEPELRTLEIDNWPRRARERG